MMTQYANEFNRNERTRFETKTTRCERDTSKKQPRPRTSYRFLCAIVYANILSLSTLSNAHTESVLPCDDCYFHETITRTPLTPPSSRVAQTSDSMKTHALSLPKEYYSIEMTISISIFRFIWILPLYLKYPKFKVNPKFRHNQNDWHKSQW